jgi:hypothetical protein
MILRTALGLLLCLLFAVPAVADSGDAIAMRGIGVDVTADNAVAAREKAVLDGQRTALHQVLLMLAQPAAVDGLPKLTDTQITDMLVDYEVESERTSTVRYIGKLAFRFRADAIRDLLQKSGIPYTVGPSQPVLVLPVLSSDGKNLLWDEGNLWLAFWTKHAPSGGLVDLRLPKSDQGDAAAISADEAIAGDLGKLQAIAARYGASDVLVAVAGRDANGPGVTLTVKHYGVTGSSGEFKDQFNGDPADPAIGFEQAADRMVAQAQQDWIDQNRVTSAVEQRLTVDAAITGLPQWAEMRRRLSTVGTLRQVEVIYLMRNKAELDLVYIGDRDQLARALQQRALSLRDGGDGRTILELAAAGQP